MGLIWMIEKIMLSDFISINVELAKFTLNLFVFSWLWLYSIF